MFFVGSGLAALIYEIVWFQLLAFVIGSTAASLAVLLGTFMGGMCLGSLAFARIIPASLHPLRVYAALEFGIGLLAIAILYLLPPAADLYASVGGHGFNGMLFRALLCAAFLLAPTVLMGATLPCAARWVESTPYGVSWLGILYTGNLGGAVFGCLLAGFYLLRLYDMATATFVAAAVNALCAALAFSLAAVAPHHAPAAPTAADRAPPRLESAAVYLTIALSGFTALQARGKRVHHRNANQKQEGRKNEVSRSPAIPIGMLDRPISQVVAARVVDHDHGGDGEPAKNIKTEQPF